eukprot:665497-Rhodomonas_salina.1
MATDANFVPMYIITIAVPVLLRVLYHRHLVVALPVLSWAYDATSNQRNNLLRTNRTRNTYRRHARTQSLHALLPVGGSDAAPSRYSICLAVCYALPGTDEKDARTSIILNRLRKQDVQRSLVLLLSVVVGGLGGGRVQRKVPHFFLPIQARRLKKKLRAKEEETRRGMGRRGERRRRDTRAFVGGEAVDWGARSRDPFEHDECSHVSTRVKLDLSFFSESSGSSTQQTQGPQTSHLSSLSMRASGPSGGPEHGAYLWHAPGSLQAAAPDALSDGSICRRVDPNAAAGNHLQGIECRRALALPPPGSRRFPAYLRSWSFLSSSLAPGFLAPFATVSSHAYRRTLTEDRFSPLSHSRQSRTDPLVEEPAFDSRAPQDLLEAAPSLRIHEGTRSPAASRWSLISPADYCSSHSSLCHTHQPPCAHSSPVLSKLEAVDFVSHPRSCTPPPSMHTHPDASPDLPQPSSTLILHLSLLCLTPSLPSTRGQRFFDPGLGLGESNTPDFAVKVVIDGRNEAE